jgi:hypothetical protein
MTSLDHIEQSESKKGEKWELKFSCRRDPTCPFERLLVNQLNYLTEMLTFFIRLLNEEDEYC